MSYYGIQLPEYWTGTTGRAIQRRGGKDATILGAYVSSSPRANMIGLYRLPIGDVTDHTPLSRDEALFAFLVLAEENYAYYDPSSEVIWVVSMARIRLGLGPDRPALAPRDKKVAGARKLYEGVGANPWLFAFFQTYKSVLHLEKRRGQPVKPLTSPLVGAMEGLSLLGKPDNRSTDLQRSEDRSVKIPAAARRPFSTDVEISEASWRQYLKTAHDAFDESLRVDKTEALGNVIEWFKTLCAQRHLDYSNPELSRKAIDAVIAVRATRAVSA